jgi:hypothetical protein
MQPQRLSSSAGIAIGPILFIIAILAVVASAMMSGGGNFQTSSVVDRINADITAQANMIRNAIGNCNMQYQMAVSTQSTNILFLPNDPVGPYPASDTTDGTAVSALLCNPLGTESLWGSIMLPPPTKGFDAWMYINAGPTGGRCLWTKPEGGSSTAIVEGLSRAAAKFNTGTTVDLSHEVVYDPASVSQKFIVWITLPATADDADDHCKP